MVAHNDTRNLIRSLTNHKSGREALWQWFKDDIDKIEGGLGHGLGIFARMVQIVTGHLATREQYESVKAFFENRDTSVSNNPREQYVEN
jgi:aminopeptidase 2